MESLAHAARPTRSRFSTVGDLFLASAIGIVTWFFVCGLIFTPLQRYCWDEYLNVAKVDNSVVRFSFPYIPPLSIQPGFIPRESVSQSKADIVDISKTPTQADTPRAQELSPPKSRKIAAGLDPFFDE